MRRNEQALLLYRVDVPEAWRSTPPSRMADQSGEIVCWPKLMRSWP
jgi:hypothetical protein